MAAQLGHQAAAGAVVEPPAHQLLHALEAVLADVRLQLLAVLLGDRRVPPVPQQVVPVHLDRLAVGVELRPGVVAVPQGADVADVAQLAGPEQLDAVGVQQAVVPLVADGQDALRLVGGLDHFLALGHVPGHQLLAQDVLAGAQGVDGDRGMQVQRQGDDHGLNVRVGQQLLVVLVDLDLLGLAAVDAVEAEARPGRLAGEDALAVGRPDVGDGDEVQVVLVVHADEDAALVAAADEADAHGVALERLVAEVARRGNRGATRGGGDQALHEVAAGHALAADGLVEILLADLLLFGIQVQGHEIVPLQGDFVRLAVCAGPAGGPSRPWAAAPPGAAASATG